MEIFECVELVSKRGCNILLCLIFIALGGVGLHALWSWRLTFFRFDRSNTTNKRNLTRLLVPLIPVSILCGLIPIVFVIFSSEFRLCLEDPKLPLYLSRIWTNILPVVGIGIFMSAFRCALIGFILYWIFGGIFLFLTTRGY